MDFHKLLDISDDWLKYAIRLNLGHESKDNLVEIRKAALADSRIKRYLSDIANLHEILVTNHKNPGLPIQKILFLIDLGFDMEVPEIEAAIDEILCAPWRFCQKQYQHILKSATRYVINHSRQRRYLCR